MFCFTPPSDLIYRGERRAGRGRIMGRGSVSRRGKAGALAAVGAAAV